MSFALGFWHWFFLAQPYDLPEGLIGANPDNFYFRTGREKFAPHALADYLESVHNPATVHAMCEDYRAGATIDYRLDEADRGQRRITCPTLVLWSLRGELQKWYNGLEIWRDWADEMQGHGIDCGHYLAEEAPDETYAASQLPHGIGRMIFPCLVSSISTRGDSRSNHKFSLNHARTSPGVPIFIPDLSATFGSSRKCFLL